ncbi:lipase, partial [Stenotrophomonas sp. C3(2023)]|nr:lipase [Stenotrophomonas sp. C3(2023)]
MKIRSQLYAALADDSYLGREVRNGHHLDDHRLVLGVARLTVHRHVDNRLTGYQGTVYRHDETGEFVVAHRGTESPMDVLSDLTMLGARFNAQAADAIALTNDALKLAQASRDQYGGAPPVTVTGHSLGGTLAQITAHHFNLKGETFN